jgi:hypothetical protein
LFSNVFSPQFLLWLFPLAVAAGLPRRDQWLLLAIGVLSALVFPALYLQLLALKAFPAWLLLMRNGLIGLLLVRLLAGAHAAGADGGAERATCG